MWWNWDDFARSLMMLVAAGVGVGVALTLVALYGLPLLWSLVSPWLHRVTA